jgi:hypothetical protein
MMVHCPDCHKEISHTAKTCPHCGCTKDYVWRAEAFNQATEGTPKWQILLVIFIFVFGAFCFIYNHFFAG